MTSPDEKCSLHMRVCTLGTHASLLIAVTHFANRSLSPIGNRKNRNPPFFPTLLWQPTTQQELTIVTCEFLDSETEELTQRNCRVREMSSRRVQDRHKRGTTIVVNTAEYAFDIIVQLFCTALTRPGLTTMLCTRVSTCLYMYTCRKLQVYSLY